MADGPVVLAVGEGGGGRTCVHLKNVIYSSQLLFFMPLIFDDFLWSFYSKLEGDVKLKIAPFCSL